MRALFLIVFLGTGAAMAEECNLPRAENEKLLGVINFSECIQRRVKDLEDENAKLRKEVETIQKQVAAFPGDLVNDNGRVTRTGGNRLTFAHFSLESRSRESVSFLALDDKLVAEICVRGCSVTLVQTAEQLRESTSTPTSSVGPCSFRYDAKNGDWTLSACGDPVSGTDGNGKPAGDFGGEMILSVQKACTLADAEPNRPVEATTEAEPSSLGRDRTKGLFLIADPENWTGSEDRFRCELTLTR